VQTVEELQERGLRFLRTPSSYYEELEERVGEIDVDTGANVELWAGEASVGGRQLAAEPLPDDRMISPTTEIRNPLQPRKAEPGGSGLVGTIGDYARFTQMLLNGGTFEGRSYLKPETVALMASDHIGPETKIARDYAYYPGPTSGFGLGFAVRTSVPPNTSWPLGEYRWDGVGGTFFFIDPVDDMFAIFMVQTPSQRGRIQLALKTLIYQALLK